MPRGDLEVRVPSLAGEAILPAPEHASSLLGPLLRASLSGLVACDLEGRVTTLNAAAERAWGAGAPALGDDPCWWPAFHPDGSPLEPGDWPTTRALRTGEGTGPEEIEIVRRDGTRAIVLAAAEPIRDERGRLAGALLVLTDVTPFRKRERELLDRTRQAVAWLARLQALTAGLSEAATPDEVARVAIENAQAAVAARTGALWLLAEDGEARLVHEIGFAPAQRERLARIPRAERAAVADVLRDGEALWLETSAEVAARDPGLAAAPGEHLAAAVLPMTVKGRALGAMAFCFSTERAFSEEERSFLLVAARHCAQALERARLYEAERRAREEAVAWGERTRFLSQASALLSSSLDYEETLTRMAQLAVPSVADWCVVDLAEDLARGAGPAVVTHQDPARIELATEQARRYPPDPRAAHGAPAVVRTGRSELYAEITDELLRSRARDDEHLRLLRDLEPRSAMIVPMIARGKTLGAITFVAAKSRRSYGPADLEMAESLARRAGLAIENARLFRRAQEAVRARQELVAVVSHDLKNPLNAILMGAGLLQRTADDPARVRHQASSIERSVGRMKRLVRDLLDLARLEAGRFALERQPHAAAALAAEAIAALQPLAQEKRLTVVAETEPAGEAHVLCDRERVLQAFSNLLGNAIAFTPDDGRVTVSARVSGGDVVFAVADTGPGITPEEQRLIFERFWTSSSSRQGTGLGLSIAKGMVEAHGGRIWVESRPGEGATFLFSLPLAR